MINNSKIILKFLFHFKNYAIFYVNKNKNYKRIYTEYAPRATFII